MVVQGNCSDLLYAPCYRKSAIWKTSDRQKVAALGELRPVLTQLIHLKGIYASGIDAPSILGTTTGLEMPRSGNTHVKIGVRMQTAIVTIATTDIPEIASGVMVRLQKLKRVRRVPSGRFPTSVPLGTTHMMRDVGSKEE